MSSGVEVSKEAQECFDNVKSKSAHKYAFFKIDFANAGDKHKSIIPDYLAPPSTTETEEDDATVWEEMKQRLLDLKEPRYILYDFKHQPAEGSYINRVTFIYWSPDATAGIKQKMLYASSKDYVQKAFSGLNKYNQCNDAESLNFPEILAASGRKI